MLRPSFCGLNFTLILILYTRGNLTRGWGLLVHFVSKWGSFSEYWHWSCSGQLSVAGYFINTASEIFKKNYNFRLVFWSPSILTRLQLVKIAVPAVAPALAVSTIFFTVVWKFSLPNLRELVLFTDRNKLFAFLSFHFHYLLRLKGPIN